MSKELLYVCYSSSFTSLQVFRKLKIVDGEHVNYKELVLTPFVLFVHANSALTVPLDEKAHCMNIKTLIHEKKRN